MTLPHAPLPKLVQPAAEYHIWPQWYENPLVCYTQICQGLAEDGRTVWLFEPDFARRGLEVLHPDRWADGCRWDAKAGYVWRYGRE